MVFGFNDNVVLFSSAKVGNKSCTTKRFLHDCMK